MHFLVEIADSLLKLHLRRCLNDANLGVAQRRYLDFTKVFGRGTMHSKFIITDKENFYLGSANLDWRSLNQVKMALKFSENFHALFSYFA